MRLRNQNSYTVPMKYKKRQLIKHIQLFAADVDVKGWLKILCKQCFFYVAMVIRFAGRQNFKNDLTQGGSVINTGAFSWDKFSVLTFSFLTRWLRNIAKNNRSHSVIM